VIGSIPTFAFAVESIRRWWRRAGADTYFNQQVGSKQTSYLHE
jgi:hypothetical protein